MCSCWIGKISDESSAKIAAIIRWLWRIFIAYRGSARNSNINIFQIMKSFSMLRSHRRSHRLSLLQYERTPYMFIWFESTSLFLVVKDLFLSKPVKRIRQNSGQHKQESSNLWYFLARHVFSFLASLFQTLPSIISLAFHIYTHASKLSSIVVFFFKWIFIVVVRQRYTKEKFKLLLIHGKWKSKYY